MVSKQEHKFEKPDAVMTDQLVCCSLLGTNFLLFGLQVSQVRVLHALERLRDVLDAFDFEKKWRGKSRAVFKRGVKRRRAEKQLLITQSSTKLEILNASWRKKLTYLFNRRVKDYSFDILGLRGALFLSKSLELVGLNQVDVVSRVQMLVDLCQ